ncbi:hypothetical protein DJ90_5572 [Paenibacillus macerans]|uniref:Uncharacterized protein n=1 Tax=Paenibacillus macerans TaxID=44252 RepID=A0A090XFV0_PAEMA|nr:hypothetical protein DJ90_5572 [Paenibacillus macerans]
MLSIRIAVGALVLSVRCCINASARAHGRRNRDIFQVNALGRSRFSPVQRVNKSFQVFVQLFSTERNLPDWRMDLTCFIQTVLDFTCFDFLNGFRYVKRNGTCFRVRHKAFTAEQTAEFTNFAHHVRRSYADIEFEPALLDFVDHVLIAYIISSGSFRFLRFVAFGEYQYALGFACAVRQDNHTANGLVLFTRVYAQTNRCFDGFVEFGSRRLLHQFNGFQRLVSRFAVDQLSGFQVFLTVFSHEFVLLCGISGISSHLG